MTKKFEKLREIIFLLLSFLIPTQLGKHFWPEWSLVNGVRIDYLSPTICVTDVLVVFLFLLTIFAKAQNAKRKAQNDSFKLKRLLPIVFLIGYIFLQVFFPSFSPLSLIKLLKIMEIGVFAWLVKVYVNKNTYRQFIFVLSLSMLFQSFLATAQFFNHGSLNGIFYWFGERNFSSMTPGIANASINGNLILRPYGTLPHPNVLAGFLLLGMIILMTVRQCRGETVASETVKRKLFKSNEAIEQWNNVFLLFVLIFSSFALFLTMSRVAILLWGIGLTLITSIQPSRKAMADKGSGWIKKKKLLFLLGVVLFIVVLFPRFSSIFTEDAESFTRRLDQTKIAVQMIKDHPLFGVGLNRYLVELPKYLKGASFRDYQPVHNVPLLLISEIGLIGLLLIVLITCKLFHCSIASLLRIKNFFSNGTMGQWSNGFLIFVVVVLSLFDHYFWTTQQGNLTIGLVIGLAYGINFGNK